MSHGNKMVAEIIIVSLLFLVSASIRGLNLSTLAAGPDELTYLSRAVVILGDNWQWPKAFMTDQPPLFIYVLAIVVGTIGGSLETLRWVSVLAGSVAVVIVYLWAKSMFDRKAGLIAAIALAFNGFDILYSRQIYIESLVLMFLAASAYLFWEGVVKRANTPRAILSGVFLGLALDTKYIGAVLVVALLAFTIIHWKRFPRRFPLRQLFAVAAASSIVFLPVLLDLAYNRANPFYYLLYGRSSHSFLGAAPNAASHLLSSGFLNFADLLIHVSSINPAQVFPLVGLNASVWLLLAGLVLVYFGLSFLFRRRLQDGFLLIIFLSFSVFFVAYPSRQSYFALYPLMAFVVMFGGFVSRAFNSMLRTRKPLLRVICIIILGLYVTAQANNIAAASATYSSGFGDWDEMKSIMSYINRNHEPGAFVVTPNDLTFYYASKYGIDVQVVPMVEPAPYYSEPPNQKILDAPLKPGLGYRPIIWVISASTIESLNPHFIVISRDNYERTDSAFRQFVNERYRQPLSTTFILLFEMRGPP